MLHLYTNLEVPLHHKYREEKMNPDNFFGKFHGSLKSKAFSSENTKGRRFERDDDRAYNGFIDPFHLDAEKIEDSKAYRRLPYKTQVFSLPGNPHARNRFVHTSEVVSFSTKGGSILGLNVSLCRAISRGHDIGHTPYGHIGERFLTSVTGKNFRHEIMGVIIAQRIERQGAGLNLNYETLQGILHHSRGKATLKVDPSLPLEFSLVMKADKIVYTLSDLNDALLRYGYIQPEDLPGVVAEFGNYQRERELTCMKALVQESAEEGVISFSKSETAVKFEALRQWMFDNVYQKVDWSLQKVVLEKIYQFFSTEPQFEGCDPAVLTALLTDREANTFAEIFHATRKPKFEHLSDFGMIEILPHIKGKYIDFTNPDMNW